MVLAEGEAGVVLVGAVERSTGGASGSGDGGAAPGADLTRGQAGITFESAEGHVLAFEAKAHELARQLQQLATLGLGNRAARSGRAVLRGHL